MNLVDVEQGLIIETSIVMPARYIMHAWLSTEEKHFIGCVEMD